MSDLLHPLNLGVIIRNTHPEDIPKIIDLLVISLVKLLIVVIRVTITIITPKPFFVVKKPWRRVLPYKIINQ
jgi:hypothetical protein